MYHYSENFSYFTSARTELKSLKMYLLFYRDRGIFHEHLVNKILDDLVAACAPRRLDIEIVMNPRGGITTTVKAEYVKKEINN